ncbi:hypothetical protein CLF_103893, partial [Clonorchis sinensis]
MTPKLLLIIMLLLTVECHLGDAWGRSAVPLVDRLKRSPYHSARYPSDWKS